MLLKTLPFLQKITNSRVFGASKECTMMQLFSRNYSCTAIQSHGRSIKSLQITPQPKLLALSSVTTSKPFCTSTNTAANAVTEASTANAHDLSNGVLMSNGAPVGTKDNDLEIKDSKVIFTAVWNKVELKYTRKQLKFPKEIIWLGGAPGSGKGTNTPFIQRVRGITSSPIVMSDLLSAVASAKAIKDTGGLASDSLVLELLLNTLLKEEYQNGVIVDGFPRTKIQVEFIKMMHDKMKDLRKEFINTDQGFRRPKFRVAVLFVDEKESVERQLSRGREALVHNQKVYHNGHGQLKELRPTDINEEAARARYKIFKDHYGTLQTLREYFPFSLINASGTISDVEQSIIREFKYQSSLELASETFDTIQHIPLRKSKPSVSIHHDDDDTAAVGLAQAVAAC